ncbi:MAG: RNA polymerase sigma factor [Alphaproteobacteria bacterium]
MFNNDALLTETDRLRKFAYRLTNNSHDAEDLVQSAVLKALEKKELFKEGTNLYAWVSKIMYNLFVTQYRRKTKFETQYDPEPYLEKQSIQAAQDTKIAMKEVQTAIKGLSHDHQDILVMICVKGMRYAEVSEKLDIPVGTVRSRLSRARENLQAELEKPSNSLMNTARYEIAHHNAALQTAA